MKNKLISMVEFVLNQVNADVRGIRGIMLDSIGKYANFLNTPLNIGMFVPAIEVAGKWVVLSDTRTEFEINQDSIGNCRMINPLELEYKKEEENVLFDGFNITKDMFNQTKRTFVISDKGLKVNIKLEYKNGRVTDRFRLKGKTIQDLIKYEPTLTKNGLIKSGLK